MDLPLEWPPENLLEPARMKYGLRLATRQLGWESTPDVAADLWRRLRNRMATCDLDVVDHNGARALCRFMYTEYWFAIPTLHDGGNYVHYREVATALSERLAGAMVDRLFWWPPGRTGGGGEAV